MDFVDAQCEKRGIHGRVFPGRNGARLVVSGTEMRKTAAAVNGRYRAIENVDQARGVLAVCVTAHRGLIDADFGATGFDQRFELALHDGDQRFGQRVAVFVLLVGNEPAAERVRAGHAHLEHRPAGAMRWQTPEVIDGAQAFRSAKRTSNLVLAALVVCGRVKTPRRHGLHGDARKKAIERRD